MSFELDRVRLTIGERNLLSRLKNPTGIDNWNIFARWAFCYSIGKASEINLNEEDGEYDASNSDDKEGVMLNTEENVMTNVNMTIEDIDKSEIDKVLK